MNTRSKLIAALLGLTVAAGAVGTASAAPSASKSIAKPVKAHSLVTKTAITKSKITKSTKILGRKIVRLHVNTPAVKHVRIVHRTPLVAGKKVALVTKRPVALQKQAFAHHLVARKTVIR